MYNSLLSDKEAFPNDTRQSPIACLLFISSPASISWSRQFPDAPQHRSIIQSKGEFVSLIVALLAQVRTRSRILLLSIERWSGRVVQSDHLDTEISASNEECLLISCRTAIKPTSHLGTYLMRRGTYLLPKVPLSLHTNRSSVLMLTFLKMYPWTCVKYLRAHN